MRFEKLVPVLFCAATVATAQQARSVRPFLSLAFTAGGDTLANVPYTDGTSSSIKAGGQTLFKGGIDYQVNRHFSLQANYGLHSDSTKEAKNGSLDFKRSALEGLVYWHPKESMRLGLGFRKVSDAKVTGSGVAALSAIHFDASTGTVLEWEYLTRNLTSFGSRAGISLRYVNEKYTPSSIDGVGAVTGASIDGSHFGVGFSWYF